MVCLSNAEITEDDYGVKNYTSVMTCQKMAVLSTCALIHSGSLAEHTCPVEPNHASLRSESWAELKNAQFQTQ